MTAIPTTPAPNNAATPTAPSTLTRPAAPVLVLALGAVVVGIIPLVKGTSLAAVAPEYATAWDVAVGIGVAVVFEGLRTLQFR